MRFRLIALTMAVAGLLTACKMPAACCPNSNMAVEEMPPPPSTQGRFLPNPYPVYTNGYTVINHPYPGLQKKYLPTENLYTGNDGCYVACYSHSAIDAIYAASWNMYVHGQLRVPGYYIGRICVPHGYEHKDISASAYFKGLCNTHIPSCNKNCWAGGDTGGWLGIQ